MNYLNRRLALIILCIAFIVSCKKEIAKPAVVHKKEFVYTSQEIVVAIQEGDLQKVKQYIDKGGDPNARCKGYTRGSIEEGEENISDQDWTLLMYADFLTKLKEFDPIYEKIKANQKPNHVLRYIGELSGDLQNDKGILEVKLVSLPSDTALGGLKGSDSFFEIYTESY